MRRVAAHYLMCREGVFRLHYIELNDLGYINGIYPLEQEIAGTAFYDGILFPVRQVVDMNAGSMYRELSRLHVIHPEKSCIGLLELLGLASVKGGSFPVDLFRIYGSGLASPEFGTDNGCGNCHIERL